MVSVARRILVDYTVGCVVAGRGGVFFTSSRLEEGAMFSEAVEDRPSPEGSDFFVSFLSVSMNVIPLACLGLDVPTVHFPVCVFAFFSAASVFFLVCYCFSLPIE